MISYFLWQKNFKAKAMKHNTFHGFKLKKSCYPRPKPTVSRYTCGETSALVLKKRLK
jgi:hypothetical protein